MKLLPSSDQVARHSKINPRETQALVEKKVAFNQKAENLRKNWICVPLKPTPKILLIHENF